MIVVIIVAILLLVFMTLKNKKVKPKEDTSNIEVLTLNEPDDKFASISEDTLNLDDLFKTISIKAIKSDPNFDFGLRRQTRK